MSSAVANASVWYPSGGSNIRGGAIIVSLQLFWPPAQSSTMALSAHVSAGSTAGASLADLRFFSAGVNLPCESGESWAVRSVNSTDASLTSQFVVVNFGYVSNSLVVIVDNRVCGTLQRFFPRVNPFLLLCSIVDYIFSPIHL